MKTRLYILWILCLLLSVGTRGQDLGPSAYSKLTWDHISTIMAEIQASIGLTTDKKMYIWGANSSFVIHKQYNAVTKLPLYQTAPFYVPSPAGETIKKVQVKYTESTSGTGEYAATFFCLSESGKLYAWGYNNGLLATAWPVPTTAPTNTLADTTRHKRAPVLLTIPGESTFVDFDASTLGNYWVAIGTSGKAYHNGLSGVSETNYTFAALPNPVGVDNATFKYTRVWTFRGSAQSPFLYLKGNNGKLYFTGSHFNAENSGVPSLPYTSSADANKFFGKIRVLAPLEVSMPAGADIVQMEVGYSPSPYQTTCALSADGKAYMTGLWRIKSNTNPDIAKNYVVIPLKNAPASADLVRKYEPAGQDSSYVLKSFVEVAMPPGVTKLLDIVGKDKITPVISGNHGFYVVGDNNKVYWSGVIREDAEGYSLVNNYLTLDPSPVFLTSDVCKSVDNNTSLSLYSWTKESINLEGASQLFTSDELMLDAGQQIGIISKSGRGYFVGLLYPNAGVGKVYNTNGDIPFSSYPVPIANEQLLNCNSSPGSGGSWTSGPVTPTNTAVGTIDCSKTKLYPAPVAGVPSQLSLIVTINVTTAGDFTPITVSGSGMSLPSGFSSVSATTTGVQTFHIPLKYDGTPLTNAFQFTVGSAGSCTADLTTKPNKQVTNVWSLTNCSAITPGVLSK